MYNRKDAIEFLIIFFILFGLLLTTPQKTQGAKFVIASWSPDEYGQQIVSIAIKENSTGSWVTAYTIEEGDTDTIFDWDINVCIRLRIATILNATLTGATSVNDGKNYFRHSVTVTYGSETVYSKQNFTYAAGADEENGLYDYEYYVILDFLPDSWGTYTITVTYEVFYW